MQTAFPDRLRATTEGATAESIVRNCVHCGFCNATCPTYQVLGDERDGPRGRIYLIKELLEGKASGQSARVHLDRCLTCRACETTCPSGVRYGELLEIGRAEVEQRAPRAWSEHLVRRVLTGLLPYPERLRPLVRLARACQGLLPRALRPPPAPRLTPMWPTATHPRRVLVLAGCAQDVLAPQINAHTARVLDRLGIQAISVPGCCGALPLHLAQTDTAQAMLRRNVEHWSAALETQQAEAIISTASGCGVTVKDYGRLLAHDSDYAARAQRIAGLTLDLGEYLARQDLSVLQRAPHAPQRMAFHAPCTLQHGQRVTGVIETLLTRVGFELTPIADAHLCCGSAGTYSLLQPRLARQLRTRKLHALLAGQPEAIASANIGCLLHLQPQAPIPVKHWIEWLETG